MAAQVDNIGIGENNLPAVGKAAYKSDPEGIEKLPRERQFDQFIADQALSQISKPALEPFDEPICYAAFNNFYRIHMKPHNLFPPFITLHKHCFNLSVRLLSPDIYSYEVPVEDSY